MIFPEGRAEVNVKCVAGSALRRFGDRCRGLGAEVGRQAVGRALQHFRAALQRLDREAPDRAGDAERADDLPAEVAHRHGDAADFQIEFAIVERDAGVADFLDLAQERRRRGDRFFGRRLEFDARKEAVNSLAETKAACRHEKDRAAQDECLRQAMAEYNAVMARTSHRQK